MDNPARNPAFRAANRGRSGLVLGLILALALPGCGGEEDKQQTHPATQSTAESPGATEGAEETPKSSEAADSEADTAQLLDAFHKTLPEGAPRPFGPFEGVELMKTPLDEVEARFKELGGSKIEGLQGRYSAHSVRGRYEQWPDTVNELVVSFPPEFDPIPALTETWGEPAKAPDDSGIKVNGERFDALYWFNADDRVRARLTKRRSTILQFKRYFPFAQFMGEAGNPRFGFEHEQPLLGATLADLEKAYGRHLDPNMKSLWFPGREFDTFLLQVRYGLDDNGRVDNFRFKLQYELGPSGSNPKQAVLDAFNRKFGEPDSEQRGDEEVLVHSGNPTVELMDQPSWESWRVRVDGR